MMTEGGRMAARLSTILRDGSAVASLERACQECVVALSVTGATISLVTGTAGWQRMCASDDAAAALEESEFALGVGPGHEAHAVGGPVLVADLAGAAAQTAAWPAFASLAVESGARAVFAFPLQVGAIRLGVLTLHRDRPGGLSQEGMTDALLAADMFCLALLGRSGDASNGDGRGTEATDLLADHAVLGRAELHQATGMVMAQLSISGEEALVRLRGFAFAHELPLAEVATGVVARRIKLDQD